MPIEPTYGFIASDTPYEDGAPLPYFRRSFDVGPGLRTATLRVTALGIVEPFLNGCRIGDEVLAPGWTSYRHRVSVRTHDVTAVITPGQNAIGAIVGEGWAVGRIGYEGKRHHYSDRPALYLELELDYGTHVERIGTDPQFRIDTGAVRAGGIYDGEMYDARLEPHGWSTPDFDDSGWQNAVAFEWDLNTLEHDVAPPIRRIEELHPVSISTTTTGKSIVDFGQVLTGWVRLTVSGRSGETITLRHAETLTPAGELEPETLRTAKSTDRYILRGDGLETWEPRFTFHGFRYVEVDGWPGELSPDNLTAVVVHSEMTRTGWFESSDPLLNRLHENVVWSMRGNFVGVPTDCPQRDERLGWTGDLHAFTPTAAFLYDVRGVLGSWLRDLAAEQSEKGFVPWVVPDVLSTPSAPTALWSDVAVGLPWALYREYGDPEILRRSYHSMTAFVDQVQGLLDPNGLWGSGYQFGDWLDPDAPADDASGGKTDRHLVATAYLVKTATEMAAAARVLDLPQDAERYAALAERVRAAFRWEYVAPSGRLVSESATAYALAICFDLLDEDQRPTAGRRLAELVAKAGYTVSTGFAGTPLVAHALSDTGHLDTAYLLLMEQECPSFLYPVTMGATTIWERWDAIRPDGTLNSTGMTSLNHYALGAIAHWMHRVIGGLEAIDAGYSRIRIAPQPGGGLRRARIVHDTVHGRVEVAWRLDGGQMTLDAIVPEGTSAEVILPLHPDAARETVGGGTHSWVYDIVGDERRERYTFDTPLKTIADDPAAWRSLTRVFRKHLPFPIDGAAPEAASITLRTLLPMIPLTTPALEQDLHEALEAL